MTIDISVSAALDDGTGLGAHIRSDHPLNHLLHPDTAAGPWGVGLDVDVNALAGGPGASVPGALTSLAEGVSGIAPSFLHLGFNTEPLPPGITLEGTNVNFPTLGIGQGIPSTADSTLIVLKDLLK
jgi:hypothetical protein